jgi:uncharacterized protein
MSQENVELVRAGFEAFERGDIEAVVQLCDPDIVVIEPSELPDAMMLRGHEGVRDTFGRWPEEWDDFRVKVLRIVDFADRVIVTMLQSGRGKDSGVAVEAQFTFLLTIKHGKLVEWRMFVSEDEALAAAGAQA